MAHKKSKNHTSNLVEALKKLPFPIYDEKHHLTVYLDDDRARSNQSRFEHITKEHHQLSVKDIESIPKLIVSSSWLKKDKIRKETFNYYLPRPGFNGHFIKVSVRISQEEPHIAKIKTIFTTSRIK